MNIDLSNLDKSQLSIVERYQEIFGRVKTLQTRIQLLETDLKSALQELENLREEEQKNN
jgi:hypothetical protein